MSEARGRDHEVFSVDVGGLAMALTGGDRRWHWLVRQRYGAFRISRPPEFELRYRLTGARSPSPRALHDGRREPLRAWRAGGRLHVVGGGFEGWIDGRRGVAELTGPLATYPVDRVLPVLFHERSERGLVFHAAALATADRGWLLSGPSGSGKSTLAALFPGNALCDELAAVRLDGDGVVDLVALPFWSGRPARVPLTAIFALRHGRWHRRRRLAPAEAFARLRRQVAWPTYDAASLGRAFETYADLVARVPVWELRFLPDRRVWDVLCAEAA